MLRAPWALVLLASSQPAMAQLALPVAQLPKLTDVNFSVSSGLILGHSELFGLGPGSGPIEFSAEGSFDAGTHSVFSQVFRFEVALAYKHMTGFSAQNPIFKISGAGQTLPELSIYATREPQRLAKKGEFYVYPYIGAHLGVFSISGVIRSSVVGDPSNFSAQTFAPGFSVGAVSSYGVFVEAAVYRRDLPFITYGATKSGTQPNLPDAPTHIAINTFNIALGVQLDIQTHADLAAREKSDRDYIDEEVRRCLDLASVECGKEIVDGVPEGEKVAIRQLIQDAKDRIRLERSDIAKKLADAQKPPAVGSKIQPMEVTITNPVTVKIENAPKGP